MLKIAYFGGEPLGVPILEALKKHHLVPQLIVASPDRPAGRKLLLTAPPVKNWALENGIEVIQPEIIPKQPADLGRLTGEDWDLFIVVAYNKILPKWFIELPKHKTINVHPSLLPKLRGASPIRTTILNDTPDECGVSVMLLDEKMDHGPILAQEKLLLTTEQWPLSGPELDAQLAALGGEVLAKTIPLWTAGALVPKVQEHTLATYCGKITKDMAELALDPYALPTGKEAYAQYLKIQAYAGWPVAFFKYDNKRYKITSARLSEDGQLVIDAVIPEGKTETGFKQLFA